MTLLEIRRKFVELSGRYDLVVDTSAWADNGANFFINAGQRWLDRKMDHKPTMGRKFVNTIAGNLYVQFPNCRSIQQVWCQSLVTDTRWLLEKKSPDWMRSEYGNIPANITQGPPVYYYPAYFRAIPDNPSAETLAALMLQTDIAAFISSGVVYDGIIFMPPADGVYTIEVWGHFYSPSFSSDTDKTYWSIEHSELLITAAMRFLEVFNRNTEGVKDWDYAAQGLIADIDQDVADEEGTDSIEMEG